jgi:hypothetical protein
MAGLLCSVTTGGATGLTEVELDGTNEKAVIILTAPTNQRLKLKSLSLCFDGVTNTAEPVFVVLARVSTAGTSTAATPKLLGVGSETPQATAGIDASAPPTKGDILKVWRVHPQSGYEMMFPMGDEIWVAGGGRVALFAKAAAAVKLMATLNYEE